MLSSRQKSFLKNKLKGMTKSQAQLYIANDYSVKFKYKNKRELTGEEKAQINILIASYII